LREGKVSLIREEGSHEGYLLGYGSKNKYFRNQLSCAMPFFRFEEKGGFLNGQGGQASADKRRVGPELRMGRKGRWVTRQTWCSNPVEQLRSCVVVIWGGDPRYRSTHTESEKGGAHF